MNLYRFSAIGAPNRSGISSGMVGFSEVEATDLGDIVRRLLRERSAGGYIAIETFAPGGKPRTVAYAGSAELMAAHGVTAEGVDLDDSLGVNDVAEEIEFRCYADAVARAEELGYQFLSDDGYGCHEWIHHEGSRATILQHGNENHATTWIRGKVNR